ncbi:MAG TPA: DNA mismatch repair endonuclease MutL [Chlamydiales bacterium]|nr:DNA mismatch repair endonuclease MutL [Chlamydiales bacterium]
MEKRIQRLPEALINQIAAGEVVENPASIVKELVENSLDAGATRIVVEVNGGGLQGIYVEDDGCGMGREDALLCLERHATSKIVCVEDLQALATMGFRGEALAAIASVSHFQLKTGNGNEATRVMAEGGRVSAVEPCARNRGTTVEVRSLFYNVPARKKFQKSVSACSAQVTRVMEALALANPNVGFILISQGRKVIEVKGQSAKERVEEILGKQDHEVEFAKEGVKTWGFLGAPSRALANRSGQHLFINGRPLFSPLISRAVKEGFGTRIGESVHPAYVLFLELPPAEIDVNVHPQKKECRFREEGKVFAIVRETISAVFGEGPLFSESISFIPPRMDFSFAEETPRFTKEEPRELEFSFPERPLVVLGNFLIVEKEGFWLVDLRAAQARILFESMSREQGEPQALIWPLEIEWKEEAIVEELRELGIESRFLGGKKLVIDALPSFLEAAHFPQFFASWKEEKKLAPAAARFYRSVKKNYSLDEAAAIWRKLQGCKDRSYDPMGNPIAVEIKEGDLERWMKDGFKSSSVR